MVSRIGVSIFVLGEARLLRDHAVLCRCSAGKHRTESGYRVIWLTPDKREVGGSTPPRPTDANEAPDATYANGASFIV